MDYLELSGALIGLLYLWLEYRASIYLWIVGVIMPSIYLLVYFKAGLYADFGISIYYLLVAAYGWMMWRRNQDKEEPPITRMPLRLYLPLTAICILSLLLIAWLLIGFTDSSVPWSDSFTTALSMVGMWMLARKYIEQWIVWIAVDVVSCILYFYKELPFTAILYGIYAVIAIFGYTHWKSMMNPQTNTAYE